MQHSTSATYSEVLLQTHTVTTTRPDNDYYPVRRRIGIGSVSDEFDLIKGPDEASSSRPRQRYLSGAPSYRLPRPTIPIGSPTASTQRDVDIDRPQPSHARERHLLMGSSPVSKTLTTVGTWSITAANGGLTSSSDSIQILPPLSLDRGRPQFDLRHAPFTVQVTALDASGGTVTRIRDQPPLHPRQRRPILGQVTPRMESAFTTAVLKTARDRHGHGCGDHGNSGTAKCRLPLSRAAPASAAAGSSSVSVTARDILATP